MHQAALQAWQLAAHPLPAVAHPYDVRRMLAAKRVTVTIPCNNLLPYHRFDLCYIQHSIISPVRLIHNLTLQQLLNHIFNGEDAYGGARGR